MNFADAELLEMGPLTLRDWAQLVGGQSAPFGETTDALVFRPKDRHIGVRDGDGALVAACGWSIVELEIEGHGTLEVVGAGTLYVREEYRGRHLAIAIVARLIAVTDLLPQPLMMIFCEAHLQGLYRQTHDFETIRDPVWVDQAVGPTLIPLTAMWRSSPDDPAVTWPAGVVHVRGQPF